MRMFWTCLVIDALVLLGGLYLGLTGRSTPFSAESIGLWLAVVGMPAAVLWGGLRLKAIGRPGAATLLLALLAVPALLVGVYMLLLVVLFASHPGGHH